MPIYDDLRNSKKRHIIFKKFLLFFFKFLSYLVRVPSFKSINSSFLSSKHYDGDNFNPTPRKQLIKIILNLLSPSAALNLKSFWNIVFYKLFYTYFYCLYLYGAKCFVLKSELYFIIFFVWLGLAFGVTVLKVLCFWYSFNKVIRN